MFDQNIKRIKNQRGFTMMELMISLTFISFLLIFIVVMTLRVAQMYNKGTTLKSINQASRTVVEQIARDISESKRIEYTEASSGNVVALCTDNASYLWNPIKLLHTTNSSLNEVKYKSPDTSTTIYLVRSTSVWSYCGNDRDKLAYERSINQEMLSSSAAVADIKIKKLDGRSCKTCK